MKWAFHFALILISLCGCTHTPIDCARFRKGNFILHYNFKQHTTNFYISRGDSTQTEININTSESSKYTISWVTDCSYETRLVETLFTFPSSKKSYQRALPKKTTIIRTAEDYYIFRTTSAGTNLVLTDTMWVDK